MSGGDQLRLEVRLRVREDLKDLSDEDLLQLGVKVYFGLLDHHEVDRWAIRRRFSPCLVEVEYLDDHVDEVFEAEAIVLVGQSGLRRVAGGIHRQRVVDSAGDSPQSTLPDQYNGLG